MGWPQMHIRKVGEELHVFIAISVIGRLFHKTNHAEGEKESNGLLTSPAVH